MGHVRCFKQFQTLLTIRHSPNLLMAYTRRIGVIIIYKSLQFCRDVYICFTLLIIHIKSEKCGDNQWAVLDASNKFRHY